MSFRRVAVVFDNRQRPETTGLYVRRALSEFVDVEHLLPTADHRLNRPDFDAVIAIDDGLEIPLPSTECPLIYWAIDTHLDYARSLRRSQQADFVYAAQQAGAARLQQDGITTATWLPLACDPVLHGRVATPAAWDWSFVGHVFPGPRQELLARLGTQFPRNFVGQAYFQEMARVYSASRIVFNRSLADDLNMRVFEGLASGSLLMTNALAHPGFTELLEPDADLVTYRDADELADKLEFHLRHEAARQRIAARGHARVLAHHTYRHRVLTLLQRLDQQAAVVSQPVPPPPASSQPAPSPEAAACESLSQPVSIEKPASIEKDSSYFEWSRPDVLALIPTTARQVLDIGCGGGRLGAALKARQPCEVWGIERDPQAAQRAKSRLDRVIVGDVGELSVVRGPLSVVQDNHADAIATDHGLLTTDKHFDTIICADILEHLRRPQELLQRCRDWLAPGGSLIVSVPNVQHHSVLTGLLDGNFTYEPAGLLDDDHVRCFTRRELEKLFDRAGFRIEAQQLVPGAGWDDWQQQGQPGTVCIGGLTISGLSSQQAADFFTYQFLFRLTPVPQPNRGLTSIILVTHNQWDYTRQCLESLRFRTDEPYELIVVDNGSTDGTPGYLRSAADVTLIENPENHGFPAAVNQGLQVARGEQILLLNNDTLLTTGWLRRLLTTLHADSQIGLVGPVSNRVSGPQQIEVTYRDLSSLDGFAWDWGQRHAGQVVELDRLVGFCLLLKRQVLDTIGGLDERFGLGNFEDDDYCRRARAAGFRTVVAVDSFVHHFGGRTFLSSGIDFAALMAENERKYHEKWDSSSVAETAERDHGTHGKTRKKEEDTEREANGSAAPSAIQDHSLTLPRNNAPSPFPSSSVCSVSSVVPSSLSEPNGHRLPAIRPKLSLCMIVRDNEHTIGPCLDSIRPWVDEMIVIDTGSTDATPDLCRQRGAQVRHWPWCDDFSAARNESLNDASGDWIFWMDSDDTIPADCGQKLRALVDGPHEQHVLGYVMQVHCPGPDQTGPPDVTVVDHVKLFRNRPDLRFEHRIHEQILPAIRRAGGDVQFTDIYVVHSGSDHSPAGRERKLERDFKLLNLDLQERPDHPFVLFNLGMTHADCRQFAAAEQTLRRCLDVSRPAESHVRKAYALLASVLYQQRRFEAGLATCRQARKHYPDDKELLFRQAMCEHQLGQLEAAAESYHQVLTPPQHRHFTSIDKELTGYKARHNLALVYEECGLHAQARQEWEQILHDQPGYEPALRALQFSAST